MSDWNPAEMIGAKPHTLASSLYSELITDHVWSKQRFDYGYKNVEPNRLMVNLAGTTYIDIRTDLTHFYLIGYLIEFKKSYKLLFKKHKKISSQT